MSPTTFFRKTGSKSPEGRKFMQTSTGGPFSFSKANLSPLELKSSKIEEDSLERQEFNWSNRDLTQLRKGHNSTMKSEQKGSKSLKAQLDSQIKSIVDTLKNQVKIRPIRMGSVTISKTASALTYSTQSPQCSQNKINKD